MIASLFKRTASVCMLILTVLILPACASIPVAAPATPRPPARSTSLTDDPERLVTLLKSNQIVFRRSGAEIEAICWCGPKVYSFQIARTMKQAIVAIEDRHFYGHRGLDPNGLLRGAWKTLSSGFTDLEGGSTITAQLIKNAALNSSQDPGRKLREAGLAWALEGYAQKDDILEWYLNQVAYGYADGNPIVGVEQAARYYFGRTAAEVSLLESAILAGMVQAPSDLNWFNHKDRALSRATLVLRAMVDMGDITEADMERALKSERPRGELQPILIEARSFMDWTLSAIRAADPAVVLDTGTRIPIALQVISQSQAEKAYEAALAALPDHGQEAAYVVMGFDGEVIVMIGQRDYGKTQLNLVTNTNSQAASSFKPFVYAAALENKKAKATSALTRMLAESDNDTAERLGLAVGMEVVADLARSMGVASALREDLGLALGTSEVNLLEMVAAYVPFANLGMTARPYGHFGIVRNGEVVTWTTPQSRRAITSITAEAIRRMLRAVVSSGTGRPANFSKHAAGKTGTSDQNRDAWFVGMTSRHVSGLWVGRLDDRPMPDISGASAAEVWGRIERALPNE